MEREVGVGEIAPAGAEAGEIEAQHRDAVTRQLLGDAAGSEDVLRAGEAVREQREGARLAVRQFEPARQEAPCEPGKVSFSKRVVIVALLVAMHGLAS